MVPLLDVRTQDSCFRHWLLVLSSKSSAGRRVGASGLERSTARRRRRGWGRQPRPRPSSVAEAPRRPGQRSRAAATATSISDWTDTRTEQTTRLAPPLARALTARSPWRATRHGSGLRPNRHVLRAQRTCAHVLLGWVSLVGPLGEWDLNAEPRAGPAFRFDVERTLNGCDSFANPDEPEPSAG